MARVQDSDGQIRQVSTPSTRFEEVLQAETLDVSCIKGHGPGQANNNEIIRDIAPFEGDSEGEDDLEDSNRALLKVKDRCATQQARRGPSYWNHESRLSLD